MVFHWSLSDSDSPQISKTHLAQSAGAVENTNCTEVRPRQKN